MSNCQIGFSQPQIKKKTKSLLQSVIQLLSIAKPERNNILCRLQCYIVNWMFKESNWKIWSSSAENSLIEVTDPTLVKRPKFSECAHETLTTISPHRALSMILLLVLKKQHECGNSVGMAYNPYDHRKNILLE